MAEHIIITFFVGNEQGKAIYPGKKFLHLSLKPFPGNAPLHQLPESRVESQLLRHDVAGLKPHADDVDACIIKNFVHCLCTIYRFLLRKRGIASAKIHVVEGSLFDYNRRVEAGNLRTDFNRFLCGENALFQCISRQSYHQLYSQNKAILLNKSGAFVHHGSVVTSAGKPQHLRVEGLDTQLDDIHIIGLQVVQYFFAYIVGPGGKVDGADFACILVFLGDCQKGPLVLQGYSRKGAAEESDFHGLEVHAFKSGKVFLDGSPCILRGDISLPGCDFFLIAENAVVGTAPV